MRIIKQLTAEAWMTVILALVGILGIAFMSRLVAEPKVLFGRSLTAIEPSLFPLLVLSALAILSVILLFTLRKSLLATHSTTFEDGAVLRVVLLFGVMLFYALTMGRIGFFLSSAVSLAGVAWLAGNRSFVQICVVSILSPIILYIIATRGLAVSLPELSSIEFLYARAFDIFSAADEAAQ